MTDAPMASDAATPGLVNGEAQPARALPVPSIPYHDDAEALRPWIQLVRAVAAVGVVVASASAGQFIIAAMPALGFPPLLPFGMRSALQALLTSFPHVLLLVGSIGCLMLRPYGRSFMLTYAGAALLIVLVQMGFVVTVAVNGQVGISGSRQALGYVLYFGLAAVQSAALPLVLLTLLRRRPVRRIFGAA